jgi:hypothetical protein
MGRSPLAGALALYSATLEIGENFDAGVFLPVLRGEMPGRAMRGGAIDRIKSPATQPSIVETLNFLLRIKIIHDKIYP